MRTTTSKWSSEPSGAPAEDTATTAHAPVSARRASDSVTGSISVRVFPEPDGPTASSDVPSTSAPSAAPASR
ncbi:hypothetical protein A7X85_33680 [Streptomyces sp. ST1015]|nr:hypothetical protein [Streptomyces sp. ST1015]QZZ30529.1 hypothetical protein A7X85_33680 [Streptomyces sp. ST1015]